MKHNQKLLFSVLWLLLGGALLIFSFTGLTDKFWAGMGCGLVGVGVGQLIRQLRYKTDAAYREQVDVANSDERNKFLSGRAWTWAGFLFVLLSAIGSIVFRIMGYDQLSSFASGSICLMMVLYWLSYLLLQK